MPLLTGVLSMLARRRRFMDDTYTAWRLQVIEIPPLTYPCPHQSIHTCVRVHVHVRISVWTKKVRVHNTMYGLNKASIYTCNIIWHVE